MHSTAPPTGDCEQKNSRSTRDIIKCTHVHSSTVDLNTANCNNKLAKQRKMIENIENKRTYRILQRKYKSFQVVW